MKDEKFVKQGRKNMRKGLEFERKVRKDLESKGWIVSKWQNNVAWNEDNINRPPEERTGKLVPAKQGKFRRTSTGFPDFICHRNKIEGDLIMSGLYEVIGVECKKGKYLDREEKEKCKILLENKVFERILIAHPNKDGKGIIYSEFVNKEDETGDKKNP